MKANMKSEVMRSAWVIYRLGGLTWSESLKKAWFNYNMSNFISGMDSQVSRKKQSAKQRMCLQTATRHQYFYRNF
jgi:hypothetical protein